MPLRQPYRGARDTGLLPARAARLFRIANRFSASVQERVDTLADRANEGLLSDDERAEYEALINAEDFVAILKLKARRQLSDAT